MAGSARSVAVSLAAVSRADARVRGIFTAFPSPGFSDTVGFMLLMDHILGRRRPPSLPFSQEDHGRIRRRLKAGLAESERRGLILGALVRSVTLAAIIIVGSFSFLRVADGAVNLWAAAGIGLFLVTGLVQALVYWRRWGGAWTAYVFITLDVVLLSLILAVPNPYLNFEMPLVALFKFGEVRWYALIMIQVGLSLSPLLVLWCGTSVILAWSALLWRTVSDPDVIGAWTFDLPADFAEGGQDLMTLGLQNNLVVMDLVVADLSVLALSTIALSLIVARARRQVRLQAVGERERATLARYFSPLQIDAILSGDRNWRKGKRIRAAILFADMRGFTALAESHEPEWILSLLRTLFSRLEAVVFEHGGAVEKYSGDAMLASFGAPKERGDDAARALTAAYAILAAVDALNEERIAAGEPVIEIGIGVHFGPVVIGDIGRLRSAAFTVIGDTVNVASRLQEATKVRDTRLLVSRALVERIRTEVGPAAAALTDRLEAGEAEHLRGRAEPVDTLRLPMIAGTVGESGPDTEEGTGRLSALPDAAASQMLDPAADQVEPADTRTTPSEL